MRKYLIGIIVFLMFLGVIAIASSNAGTQSDPLVSVSYLNKTFLPKISANAASVADKALSEKNNSIFQKFFKDISIAEILAKNSNTAGTLTLLKNDTIRGVLGSEFTLTYGMAKSAGNLINLTTGKEVPSGSSLTLNNRYFFTEKTGAFLTVTSKAAVFENTKAISATSVRKPKYESYANALKYLNLFKGTNYGFELGRPSDRAEGVTMLIRLLGEEDKALAFTKNSPFSDVADWNKPYVSYAFEKGYTKGISNTKFGSTNDVLANHYLTFILRALGYSDADFAWDKALEKAKEIGLIDAAYYNTIKAQKDFYRDDIVYVSFLALNTKLKDSQKTLSDKLIEAQVFSANDFEKAKKNIS